jgi:putative flippase GtrA
VVQALVDRARVELGRKTVRYAMVSVVAVFVGQSVLIICSGLLGLPGVTSNIIAVSIGTIPSYLLNRYWTWGKKGKNSFLSEVLPFWGMAVLGLVFSTWLVAIADRRYGTTVAVAGANLAAFGVLWVVKFMVLNHVLFKVDHGHVELTVEDDADDVEPTPA